MVKHPLCCLMFVSHDSDFPFSSCLRDITGKLFKARENPKTPSVDKRGTCSPLGGLLSPPVPVTT